MALNLDKSNIEKSYYYSEKGNTYGPFLLSVIISKINTEPSNINAETLITSDGNKWTKANEIPELKIYFNKGQPKKVRTNKLFIWAIFIGFVGGGLLYYLNNKNNYTPPIEEPLTPTREDELSDFEIFDIYAIRNLNPSEEQKLLASNLVEEAKVAMKNQDYTNAIIKYKESLKKAPIAETYFELSEVYLKTNDFDRSEKCLKLANELDYQPKSVLDKKLMAMHAIQGKFDVLTNEIITQIALNKNYLTLFEKDTLFYDYRQSENYLHLIEKDAIMDSTSDYLSLINSYYEEVNNNSFDATVFYSEQVTQFINKKNTNPDEINQIISQKKEYIDGHFEIIGNKLMVTGVNSRDVWGIYTCYRTSKKKYQKCRVKISFIFDEYYKITSYKELELKDLIFTK